MKSELKLFSIGMQFSGLAAVIQSCRFLLSVSVWLPGDAHKANAPQNMVQLEHATQL